ncbi:hypothetical protein [Streptomyces noursei]|uniref:hypothetical protein n=1 Tax=Streptomyces noursei TaxID=1971 RepID=UPI00056E2276|nr:hypothetical protein [Streptomyces noursei]
MYVQHPETREVVVLLPGEEPTEDLARLVTNPCAWEPTEPEDGAEPEVRDQVTVDDAMEAGDQVAGGARRPSRRSSRASSA